jgi:hypothetical protein
MRKVTLSVREKLEYMREIVVYLPEDMSESDLEGELDEAQRGGDIGISDFVYTLKRSGITLAGPYDDSMDCPYSMEVECEEYDFVKEEETA